MKSDSRQLRDELRCLHGGVLVTLEQATVTGDLPVIEGNLREIERRLGMLLSGLNNGETPQIGRQ